MIAPDRAPWRATIPFLVLLLASGCARLSGVVASWHETGTIAGRVEWVAPEEGESRSIGRVDERAGPVLVYLEAIDSSASSTSRKRDERRAERVVIRDGRQEPEIQLVRPEQPVHLHNLDSIYHELFTVDSRNSFRVRLEGGEESESIQLSHSGFVRGFCRLHPSETFAFVVSDTRHFVLLEDGSHFQMSGLAPGDYRIRAVAIDSESEGLRVRVEGDQTTELTLGLVSRSIR